MQQVLIGSNRRLCSTAHTVPHAAHVTVVQVSSALDKLSTRERFLNSQCEHLTAEYRDAKEHLSQLQMQFNQKQDAAAELDNELTTVVKVPIQSLKALPCNNCWQIILGMWPVMYTTAS